MKTGLVLEGGGVRGIYAAGVLDVFLEKGIRFNGVIGNSAGAIHGCSYLSEQKGRSIRYYKKYCDDPRFMSFRSWLTTGDLVGVDFCYHELPEKLDVYDNEAFKRNNIPFYAVCTNVETGAPEYIKCTDMNKQIDVIRASSSMPFLSKIVCTEGKKLLDGGVSDSIPVKKFMEMGYDRIIVVLPKAKGYVPKPNNVRLSKSFYSRFPAFVDALITRHLRYADNLRYVDEMEDIKAPVVY